MLAAVAVVGGLALAAHGAWIPAKAALGQALLADAWRRARGGERAPRPWPWADLSPIARLRAPGRAVDLLVLDDASGRTLAWGPGLLPDSAPPGTAGHTVLAGHRDTHFRFLGDLTAGEMLSVEDASGRTRRYQVTGARVAHELDASVTAPQDGVLTLVTCWPLDAVTPGTPWRFVVTAHRVTLDAT